ncbi:MAG: DUF2079 domain-containing protein [Ktedonobacteraceae bacterium]
MVKRFDIHRQRQIAWWLLIVVMLVYALEMSHQAVLRYDTFKATAFDLGNMDQVIWNTIHGRWFQFTNQATDYYGPPTRLAVHFEPIILPLSLLYLFYADPRILLVFQTLVLVSGALPVFLLTRKYLPEWPILASLMVGAYLLSPALLGLNIFDFHPISLATPLLLYAMLALDHKRYGWFVLACILAAMCKEDVPLTIAVLGLFLIWKYKLPRLGITLTIGGLLWAFIGFSIISHFYPGAQHNNFWYRYQALGSSPGEAIVNLIIHPWLFFTTFITLNRLYYLASLFRSTGFLSLLAPEWLLLALPGLAINLLSTDSLSYSGVYHYNASIIPFVMLSAIHGTRRLISLWQGWRGEKSENITLQSKNSPEVSLHFLSGAMKSSAYIRVSAVTAVIKASLSAGKRFLNRLVEWVCRRHIYMRLARIIMVRRSALAQWLIIQWQRFSERMVPLARGISVLRLQWITFAWITVMLGLNLLLAKPLLDGFWADHEPGSREQHIQQLLALIPPDASVSASSNINPHVSERQLLAVFPAINVNGIDTTDTVQYIIVDLNAVFPEDRGPTTNKLNHLKRSGQYIEIGRAEGVVLLVRRTT